MTRRRQTKTWNLNFNKEKMEPVQEKEDGYIEEVTPGSSQNVFLADYQFKGFVEVCRSTDVMYFCGIRCLPSMVE